MTGKFRALFPSLFYYNHAYFFYTTHTHCNVEIRCFSFGSNFQRNQNNPFHDMLRRQDICLSLLEGISKIPNNFGVSYFSRKILLILSEKILNVVNAIFIIFISYHRYIGNMHASFCTKCMLYRVRMIKYLLITRYIMYIFCSYTETI